jgi:hypothetical protein
MSSPSARGAGAMALAAVFCAACTTHGKAVGATIEGGLACCCET